MLQVFEGRSRKWDKMKTVICYPLTTSLASVSDSSTSEKLKEATVMNWLTTGTNLSAGPWEDWACWYCSSWRRKNTHQTEIHAVRLMYRYGHTFFHTCIFSLQWIYTYLNILKYVTLTLLNRFSSTLPSSLTSSTLFRPDLRLPMSFSNSVILERQWKRQRDTWQGWRNE